jgi:hypothetical protein
MSIWLLNGHKKWTQEVRHFIKKLVYLWVVPFFLPLKSNNNIF